MIKIPQNLAPYYAQLDNKHNTITNYLSLMTTGGLPCLMISGPAGLGKSSVVSEYIRVNNIQNAKIVKGHARALNLYHMLYTHREAGSMLVLDDIDSVFTDISAANILKAAMDTTPIRRISWETQSNLLKGLQCPTEFEYRGSVVLITNIDHTLKAKESRNIKPIVDRAHYINMSVDHGLKGAYIQISYMVYCHDMLARYNLSDSAIAELMAYIEINLERLNTVSLRTIVKLAELRTLLPDSWLTAADGSLLRPE
jgi:hypothetical protein